MLKLIALLCLPGVVLAQAPRGPDSSAAPERTTVPALPRISAVRVTDAIRIDGRLDEAAWAGAPVATGFTQIDPHFGQPATEETEVRVLYDDEAIYLGARMFDSDPSKIRARLGRRDESLSNADLIEFYLDSYHNRVDGYLFRVTPAGAVRDAVVLAGGGQDNSWDAVWESSARVDSLGWVAELRIPFSQLRFSAVDGAQTWGLQVARIVARKNEGSHLAYTPPHMAGGPQRWGTLEGLRDLPRARHIEVLPYVTSRSEHLHVAAGDPFRGRSELRMKGGADLRVGLGSSMMLSATVNPDFGQVEVDPARVNLSANELFFPERRPFFVEGADLFRYGRIRSFNNRGVPTIFHSRRIGRAPQRNIEREHDYTNMPDEATIASAVKLTGRTRDGLAMGVLNALTLRETARWADEGDVRGDEAVEPLTNYFAARARQDLAGGNTQVGVIATAVNRDLADATLGEMLRRDAYFIGADVNQSFQERMYSLDASLGYSTVHGTAAAIDRTQRSSVHYFQRPDLGAANYDPARTSLGGYTWQLAAAKNSGRHTIASVAWQGVSPGFESNDIGFQSSSAFHAISTVFALKSDDPIAIFRDVTVGPFSGHGWNFDGDATDVYYGMHIDGRFRNLWGFNLNVIARPEAYDDRATRGGPVMGRPSGKGLELSVRSDQRRIYFLEGGYEGNATDIGDRIHSMWLGVTVRPSSALRVSVFPSYERSTYATQYLDAAPDTTANGTYDQRYVFGGLAYNQLSLDTRVDWTFSPRLSLQMFVQPLVADGEYRAFRSLARARTLEFVTHSVSDSTLMEGPDGYAVRGPAAGAPYIAIGRPDFSSRALVGNAVVRWEYRPGSALFFVWQQRRTGDDGIAGFSFRRDVTNTFRDAPENVFAVKATYWIGL